MVAAEGRVVNSTTTEITFRKWYVTVADCRTGHGKVVTLSLQGDYQFENDFVLDGGSVSSALAEMLCYDIVRNEKKGI